MATKSIKQLREMAMNIGDSSYNPLNKSAIRKHKFESTKEHDIIKNYDDNISLHRKIHKDKSIDYTTNDHHTGETLHFATFSHHKLGENNLPFEHDEQSQVARNSTALLKHGYAKDVAYDHFKSREFPLVSSKHQFLKGHKMWHQLVDRALDDGHHVYHWDGNHLHKTTQENKEDHLKKSFGKDQSFEHKHMIISKSQLHE